MLDAFFCPRVVARLRAGVEPAILEALVTFLHHRGHARSVIQTYVRAAEIFLRWLHRRRRSIAAINEATVRTFACRQRSRTRPRASTHAALRHLLRHLREQGRVPCCPSKTPVAIGEVVAAYEAHLRDVRGLAPATRLYRHRYACEFLTTVFGTAPIHWERIRPRHAFIPQHLRTQWPLRCGQGGRGLAPQFPGPRTDRESVRPSPQTADPSEKANVHTATV